jgi:hypothetical protein
MHHFDDDRRRDVRVGNFADGIGRERDERRAQVLAAAVERVLRVRDDLRIKFMRLPGSNVALTACRNGSPVHDLFPGTIWRWRSANPQLSPELATFDSAASIRLNLLSPRD